jgi:periplasmic copper chaperone A
MRHLIGAFLFLLATAAWAGDVTLTKAWARETAPGQDSGSIQFVIQSEKDAKLIAVASPVAESVEIHSMVHENGRMKMRAIESINLPAKREVNLGKSGNHVMLLNLKQPLKAGDSVPFTVTVEFADHRKETLEAKATVKGSGMEHDMHDMPGM